MRKDKQILGSCKRAEKAVEHEGNSDTNSNWCTGNGHQELGKILEELEIKDEIETIQIILRSVRILYRILETERNLFVIQILMKAHQLKVVWKSLKEGNSNPCQKTRLSGD